MKVEEEYVFAMRASRGETSPKKMAQAAHDAATTFFRDHPFELSMVIKGKADDWQADCLARGTVETGVSWDGEEAEVRPGRG